METYALVTAAHNEEKYIEETIKSVTSQTVLPCKWIIVSDGSTDRTDDIVRRYATAFQFIHLLRWDRNRERNFASKVFALNAGRKLTKIRSFEFVGHLDADVSFESNYFQDLFQKFKEDPDLGIAGGFIYEGVQGKFISVDFNRTSSVGGAVQMFRSACLESIGDLLPLKHGNEDTYLEIAARIKGWHVQSFPELQVRHHRTTGSAVGALRYRYWQGLADYSIGYHPIFELARLVRHISYRPFSLGPMAHLCGFVTANLRGKKKAVPRRFVAFLRKEQGDRLRSYCHKRWLSALKRIEVFWFWILMWMALNLFLYLEIS